MTLRFDDRNMTTHAADTACASTLANAAPYTLMWSVKMNSGSSATDSSAPMSVETMAMRALPWAVMNVFNPSASCTKMVPERYTERNCVA